MGKDTYPSHETEAEVRDFFIRILGAGAGNPTLVNGAGVTVTWVSTGLYEITWKEDPKNYLGLGGFMFEATTPGALSGYTVVAGNYNASTKKLRVSVYNATVATTLADLAAAQWLNLTVKFKETKV
jgi:hypothetical protein